MTTQVGSWLWAVGIFSLVLGEVDLKTSPSKGLADHQDPEVGKGMV